MQRVDKEISFNKSDIDADAMNDQHQRHRHKDFSRQRRRDKNTSGDCYDAQGLSVSGVYGETGEVLSELSTFR